jgi:hypothetical protein
MLRRVLVVHLLYPHVLLRRNFRLICTVEKA